MSRQRGFTLIELVVVLTIIALLSTMAVRQYWEAQEQAYLSTVKGDLRNFALGEESHFYDNGSYSSVVADIEAGGFRLSPGVQIEVVEATNGGWSATGRHQRGDDECYVYSGNAAPVGNATQPGTIVCT